MDDFILEVDKWTTPVSHYKEEELWNDNDGVRITKVKYDEGIYLMEGVGGYAFLKVNKPIEVTVLQSWDIYQHKWVDVMVDDPLHDIGMRLIADACSGDVLVAGLGLGLVIHYLMNNEEVDRVTVVENNELIVKLISKYLDKYSNLKIVISDYNEFLNKLTYIYYIEYIKELSNEQMDISKPLNRHINIEMPYDTAVIDLWTTTYDTPMEKRREISNQMTVAYLKTGMLAKKVYIWGMKNPELNPAIKRIVDYPGIEFEDNRNTYK